MKVCRKVLPRWLQSVISFLSFGMSGPISNFLSLLPGAHVTISQVFFVLMSKAQDFAAKNAKLCCHT